MDEALQMPTPVSLGIGDIFKEKVAIAKKNTTNELKAKLEEKKIEIILQKIKEDNISFSFSGTTLKELKDSVKEQLTGINLNKATLFIEETERELDKLLIDLEKGSTSAFKKFITEKTQGIKEISKAASITLAGRTALILAPTIGMKIVVAGALTGISAYKLIKEAKYKKVVSRENQCNRVLEKLELTFDKNGKIIDTRFSQPVQDLIRNFLKENKISFIDTGYLSLREQIYNLDYEKKLELANKINNELGNKININSIITNKEEDFFEKIKKNTRKVIATTESAILAAIGINTVDPAITVGPINAILGANIVKKITSNKLIQNITGISAGIGTKLFEHLPFVGQYFQKAFAIENIGLFAASGLGLGIISIAGIELLNVLKNLIKRFKIRKDQERILKLDNEKYAEENKIEFIKMKENITQQKSLEEQVIIDLVTGYANDNQIEKIKNVRSIKELKQQIEELNATDKKKINKYLKTISEYNDTKHSEFVKTIMKCGKILLNAAIIGLAGMSIYDLLTGNKFLESLLGRTDTIPINTEGRTTIHTTEDGHTFGGGGRGF